MWAGAVGQRGHTVELRRTEAQLAQQQLQLSALVVAVPRGGMHVLAARVCLMPHTTTVSRQPMCTALSLHAEA
jgi:hypothetical protein